jgi:hypothetical protein
MSSRVRDGAGRKVMRTREDIHTAMRRDLYARLVYSRFERHQHPLPEQL